MIAVAELLRLSCYLSLLLAFASSGAAAATLEVTVEEGSPPNSFDTNRDAIILDVSAVRPNGEYRDSISVHTVTDMEVSGIQVHSVNDMAMDIQTILSSGDGGDGTHQVKMTFTRVWFAAESMGQSFECDSSNHNKNKVQGACDPFYDMIGTTMELVVDEEGNSVSPTTTTHEDEDEGVAPASPAAPTDQLLATSRLLNLLPRHPVAPGDTWDATQNTSDGMFRGTATLLGYYRYYEGRVDTRYEDRPDVAVLQIDGTQTLDADAIAQKLAASGGSKAMASSDISVSDVDLHATVYFDYQAKFPRFTTMDLAFTMQMKSPLDGSDLTIPVRETVETHTKLKGET